MTEASKLSGLTQIRRRPCGLFFNLPVFRNQVLLKEGGYANKMSLNELEKKEGEDLTFAKLLFVWACVTTSKCAGAFR